MLEVAQELIGQSPSIRALKASIADASRSDAKVLITGESGTGKEITAQLIHRNSRRRARAFLPINCAGLPETLLESELFGHERGSFTGAVRDRAGLLESASYGTAFLDEIGEMTPRLQGLLLRFLETGEIQRIGSDGRHSQLDVRVIAATHRDLKRRMERNEFRLDLYYRLNVIHLHAPSLRERREDIPLLLEHFFEAFSRKYQTAVPLVDDNALAMLTRYEWPGNVRELKNAAERLVVNPRDRIVTTRDLPVEIRASNVTAPRQPLQSSDESDPEHLFERMVTAGESFWTAVYEPFMSRDLTREDVRRVITLGLEHTLGNYKLLVRLFNMQEGEYKRLLNFLKSHRCHVPYQGFRSLVPAPAGAPAGLRRTG